MEICSSPIGGYLPSFVCGNKGAQQSSVPTRSISGRADFDTSDIQELREAIALLDRLHEDTPSSLWSKVDLLLTWAKRNRSGTPNVKYEDVKAVADALGRLDEEAGGCSRPMYREEQITSACNKLGMNRCMEPPRITIGQ